MGDLKRSFHFFRLVYRIPVLIQPGFVLFAACLLLGYLFTFPAAAVLRLSGALLKGLLLGGLLGLLLALQMILAGWLSLPTAHAALRFNQRQRPDWKTAARLTLRQALPLALYGLAAPWDALLAPALPPAHPLRLKARAAAWLPAMMASQQLTLSEALEEAARCAASPLAQPAERMLAVPRAALIMSLILLLTGCALGAWIVWSILASTMPDRDLALIFGVMSYSLCSALALMFSSTLLAVYRACLFDFLSSPDVTAPALLARVLP
ncbi:MAG TPA: hypothetical protein PKW33_12980 [Anaerolineaceae bacterium]|nr:hypothetical protein [Anaerolineaceae bacterium]HPN52497.1 hypothetical protein [Anaerolineaceae bacterium]